MSCRVDRVGKVYKALLTVCLISLSIFSFGQGKEFIKKNFKDNVKGFKQAMDSIKKGDFYYNPESIIIVMPFLIT